MKFIAEGYNSFETKKTPSGVVQIPARPEIRSFSDPERQAERAYIAGAGRNDDFPRAGP